MIVSIEPTIERVLNVNTYLNEREKKVVLDLVKLTEPGKFIYPEACQRKGVPLHASSYALDRLKEKNFLQKLYVPYCLDCHRFVGDFNTIFEAIYELPSDMECPHCDSVNVVPKIVYKKLSN